MQHKMNREIRDYKENVFFGLSLRQCIFSFCAVAIAVALYFFLEPVVGTEAVSWMCIVGAAPFAALGFVHYNGMNAEQFLWAYLQSEVLTPRVLLFGQRNRYYELMKNPIRHHRKEGLKHGIQNTQMDQENA